jgi:hypothetical protein
MGDISKFARSYELLTEPIDKDCVKPPPWELNENETLDRLYINFMQELQKTKWDIKFTEGVL